ncbi:hypothetical protein K7432_013822 [Basidiobolus ranarum]|uniref:Uncharacterized protein n=1 Tax=Basidiobolus ranarum TaxID=34480 RepID=A0ABR2WIK4_9FUNG
MSTPSNNSNNPRAIIPNTPIANVNANLHPVVKESDRAIDDAPSVVFANESEPSEQNSQKKSDLPSYMFNQHMGRKGK